MTREDAFIKGAADRFEELKLAGWVDLVKGLGKGGLTGLGKAWGGMAPTARNTLMLQGLGGALGVGGALATRDDDESALGTAGRALLYGAGGGALAGLAGKSVDVRGRLKKLLGNKSSFGKKL